MQFPHTPLPAQLTLVGASADAGRRCMLPVLLASSTSTTCPGRSLSAPVLTKARNKTV